MLTYLYFHMGKDLYFLDELGACVSVLDPSRWIYLRNMAVRAWTVEDLVLHTVVCRLGRLVVCRRCRCYSPMRVAGVVE